MKKSEFQVETGLVIESCINCGIVFAIPEDFREKIIKSHKTFYCPNGHTMYYPGKTKEEVLSNALKQCKISNESYKRKNKEYDYRARYWKGKVTKIQKSASD